MEELIFKYLSKTLTQQENEQLQSWLDLDEENRITLNKLSSYYRNDESKLPLFKEVVWNEVNEKLGVSVARDDKERFFNWNRLLKIAAVFLLTGTSAFLMYQFSHETTQDDVTVKIISKEAPQGSKVTTKLPDGSLVTLNSGSVISFPKRFSKTTRDVTLSGEAFFEVEHNPDKPFLVRMNGDVVKVLGTSFNIRAYPVDSTVYVSVATGRVSYSILSGDEVILDPHQMATYIPGKGRLWTDEVNKLQAFGWKDKLLYFNDVTFDKVVLELERWYGIEIDYDQNQVSRGTYSEQFTNPTLREVLHSLSFVYRFDFKIDGKKVSLIKTAT